jgi:hypothetical protein
VRRQARLSRQRGQERRVAQVAVRDDPAHVGACVDDREVADALAPHQVRRHPHRVVEADHQRVFRHHVADVHA